MKAAYSLVFLVAGLIYLTSGVKEEEHHGGKHNPIKQGHFRDGDNNPHYDHEAMLGNRELEKEFDDLEPEEAQRRLRILFKKVDKDGNGKVNMKELTDWIMSSFQKLDADDAEEQFLENDDNSDGQLTWKEYVQKQYGYDLKDLNEYKDKDADDYEDFNQMIEDEKLKFDAADLNKDGILDKKEHIAFVYPYDYKHMHEIEMKRTMDEHDKNKDGIISYEEFMNKGELSPEDHQSEWAIEEKERFGEYDSDKDGHLDSKEIKEWVLPDNSEAAGEEAEHLIQQSDDNGDSELTEEEMVNHHDHFVGSQATNYGAYLPKDEL